MKIHNEYTSVELWNGATTIGDAAANIMDFFVSHEEFDCIDFVRDTTTSSTNYYVMFAHKDRVPRLDDSVKYNNQNFTYGLIQLSGSGSAIGVGVATFSPVSNSMKIYNENINNVYLVFTRNENDECMFTFYENSYNDATSIVFAKDLSGEMCLIGYQTNAAVTVGYTNKTTLSANIPMCYSGETKKYLLPCIVYTASAVRVFKRLFWSLNLPQGYRHVFTLGGKQYIESAECNTANKVTLALLYDEG